MNARLLALPFLLVLGTSGVALAKEPPLGTAVDYLTVADIAVLRGEWMTAERILRDGMDAHPESDGFHLSLGYVLESQGRIADAFYEYQYEVVRSTHDRLAKEAARKSSLLLERTEADEPRRVMAAIELARTNPAAARKALAAIPSKGTRPFALRLYETECTRLAGDLAAAERGYRALIASDPLFAPAHAALADLLEETGHADEAARIRAKLP